MVLSDGAIIEGLGTGQIGISPYPKSEAIQPASVDLRLSDDFRTIGGNLFEPGDFPLKPTSFVLGSTIEQVTVPNNMVARVEGKSSLARMGILVHVTAGFIDPGFSGRITLEFANLSTEVFNLVRGMYICQISFETLDRPALRPYGSEGLGSSYQNQTGTRESKYA